jgi:ABC-2 type transport system ATP-binding protein
MQYIIETADLRKRYGSFEAVRDLTLGVPQHSICAFLGQNGAGKSTTLRMLLGMVHPTSGSGRVFGLRIDDERDSVRIRKRAAFVAEDKRLYDYMTVAQILDFTRSFFPTWRRDLEKDLVRRFELPVNRRIRKLSKGMRTKLALLLAVARGNELLILDEPTEGLDPVAIEEVLALIVSLAADGTTVLFSSHQIAEVEQIADHVLMIDRGELLLDSSLDRVRETYRHIHLVFPGYVNKDALTLIGVENVRSEGRTMSLIASSNVQAITERARLLHAISIEVEPVSMKEIFLATVKARSSKDNEMSEAVGV